MSSTQNIFKATNQATLPQNEVYTVSNSVVVDSRERNCIRFKNPSFYELDLDQVFKNVNSIELKGVIFPKSSYNIHSSNNNIDFAIGDFITGFYILDGGAGYTIAPTVTISSPSGAGVQATATAVINTGGSVTNLIIGVAGSGYIPSTPPVVILSRPNNRRQERQPRILAIVGNRYTATLRIGEYDIGGNPIPPAILPTNLLLEIQNSMNYVVNAGNYDPISTSPFAVRVVSQYPTLGAIAGTPEASDTNACLFNRIQVINTDSSPWEFLWGTGPNKVTSSASVFGFNTVDSGISRSVAAIVTGSGTLIPGGTAIRGCFDYNLKNDPDYVIMTIFINNKRMDRLKSPNTNGLDNTFAVLLFDNNNPETLHDLSSGTGGSIVSVNDVKYLQGPTGKGTFWRDAGSVKPIKGTDFDAKRLSFKPPIGSVNNMTIQFTKFGYKPGGVPLFYNMEGREHVLLFEFSSSDQRSRQRE